MISKNTHERALKTTAWLGLGVLLAVSVVTPAQAYPARGGDRDWHGHEARGHAYWHGRYVDPYVVYAPPVVYTPPPVEESPGINLILPLHIH